MEDISYFDCKANRHQYVRGVFAIVAGILLVDFLLCIIALHVPEVRKFLEGTAPFFYAFLAAFIILYVLLFVCDSFRRNAPINYIMLLLFTVFSGFMLAALAATFNLPEVMMVAFGLFLAAFTLATWATCTKIDVTGWAVYLVIGIILLVAAITALAVTCGLGYCDKLRKIIGIIIAAIIAILLGFYMVFHLQTIMKGKHCCAVQPDEYIFGALTLWTDMILLPIDCLFCSGCFRNADCE